MGEEGKVMEKMELSYQNLRQLMYDIEIYMTIKGLRDIAKELYEDGVTSAEILCESSYNDEGGYDNYLDHIKFYVGDREAKYDYANKHWLEFFANDSHIAPKMSQPNFDVVKLMEEIDDKTDDESQFIVESRDEFIRNFCYNYVDGDDAGEFDLVQDVKLDQYEIRKLS
jgi:hypothetical protein